MMVSVEATGSLERRLEVSVPAGEVESAFNERLKSFSRTARLKGFRPGKAPLAVVQRQFGSQIREEVVSELVRVTLANALDQQKLSPVAGPRIDPLPAAPGGELRYAAVFEIYPQIELKGLADNVRGRVRGQLLEKLLAANPIELPRVAVESQLRSLQIEWLRRVGARPEDLKEAPPREPFEEAARRRVATGLLLGEVIRREGLKVDPARLSERIASAAASYSEPEEAAKQIRANDALRRQLEAGVLEDQAIDYLLGQVRISEQPTTFKELLNFGA